MRCRSPAADLTADAGWPEAVAGCAYVLHVASPFPQQQPRNEDELIVPAREGALRVLRAARDAGVERVVLTSSFAAIGYGHKQTERPFTEEDWTDPNAGASPYVKSKTLAERAAWDFVAREGGALELAVVNPVGVLGPVLGPDLSSSIPLVKRCWTAPCRARRALYFSIVDVRDVADLHLRAMTDPAAKGERFLAVAGDAMSLKDVADVLRARMGAVAERVPSKELPDWLVKLVALVNPAARQVAPDVGKISAPRTRRPGACSAGSRGRTKRRSWRRRRAWCGWGWSRRPRVPHEMTGPSAGPVCRDGDSSTSGARRIRHVCVIFCAMNIGVLSQLS